MTRKLFLCVVCVLLVTVGCTAEDAPTEVPPTPTPEAAAPTTTTASADELMTPGLLPLTEAREIALRVNPDIHAARARLEAALSRIAEARSFYARIFEVDIGYRDVAAKMEEFK